MHKPALSACSGTGDRRPLDLAAHSDRIAELAGREVAAWLMFHLPRWGARALDSGCGTGRYTEILAGRFNEVLAVDPSAPMVAHAHRHRPRGNICYEIRHPDEVGVGGDGQFDLVFSAHALRDVPESTSALQHLQHLRSLARPEGLVLLVQPVADPSTASARRLRTQALRTFRDDALRRRRPIREAAELLRLTMDRGWLDHHTATPSWTTSLWDELTSHVLPGARTTELDRARALHWRVPSAFPRS